MRITHFSSTLFFPFSVVVVDFFLRLNLIFCSNIPVIVGCIPLNLHFFVVKVLCWTLLPPFGPYSWSSRLLWGLDRWWEHRGSRLWPSHQLFWEVGYRIDTVNPFFTVDLFASVYLGFFFFSFVCSPTNRNCRRKDLANCSKLRMDMEGILVNHLSGCSSKCSANTWQYVASYFCGCMFIFVKSTVTMRDAPAG